MNKGLKTLVLPGMWLYFAEGSSVVLLSAGLLDRFLLRLQECIAAEACDKRLRLFLWQRFSMMVRLDAKRMGFPHFQPLIIEAHGIGCIATALVCPTP